VEHSERYTLPKIRIRDKKLGKKKWQLKLRKLIKNPLNFISKLNYIITLATI